MAPLPGVIACLLDEISGGFVTEFTGSAWRRPPTRDYNRDGEAVSPCIDGFECCRGAILL
jgi:hypothetical protein